MTCQTESSALIYFFLLGIFILCVDTDQLALRWLFHFSYLTLYIIKKCAYMAGHKYQCVMPQIKLFNFDMEHSGRAQYRLCYDDHLLCKVSRHEDLTRNSTQNQFDTFSSLGQLFLDYCFSGQINELLGRKISMVERSH